MATEQKPVCPRCKGTGRVNGRLGSLRCGACATDPVSRAVQKVIQKEKTK